MFHGVNRLLYITQYLLSFYLISQHLNPLTNGRLTQYAISTFVC
jgi:hypothetical protein